MLRHKRHPGLLYRAAADCDWSVREARRPSHEEHRRRTCAGTCRRVEETVEMSTGRRHVSSRKVMREVARWWAVPVYVAFGLGLAHFDTSAPWWAVVLITLSAGTGAMLGAAFTLGLAATALHSLWRHYGHHIRLTGFPGWSANPSVTRIT